MASGLEITAALPEHALGIATVYAPVVESTAISFEQVPPDPDEIVRRMVAAPRLPWLVATRDGDVVGHAYAAHHRARPAYRWAVDCSIYLAASEQGQGTGRLLYERLLPLLRDLGYVQALAGVTLPNPASIALHERMGFAPVGVYRDIGFKIGRWHDVGWWQLSLIDVSAPSAGAPAAIQLAEPRAWVPPRVSRRPP